VAVLTDAPLLDSHCHPVVTTPIDAPAFELLCSEAASRPRPGESYLDSQIGHAVRRWCAPVLGLAAHATMAEYLAARDTVGAREVTRRMLRDANLSGLLVDTGLPARGMTSLAELADDAGAPAVEVVRLETLAERVAAASSASQFADDFTSVLWSAIQAGAVATKSIVAYRHGLGIAPERPTRSDVAAAAGRWLRASERSHTRLTDPTILRFLLWSAVDTARPIQLHTGFGDSDAGLVSANPGLLQPFCAATQAAGAPLILLHCYPYHRQAGWLAHLYPHVYVDIGLTITYVGARAREVLAEFLELAPFGKLIYSSDAYGLPELYLVGAAQFRWAIHDVLTGMVNDGAISEPDAARIAGEIGAGNAGRVYLSK
jgi:predicted TIM-barrel fold metal-dependent hydrolase